MNSLYVVMPFFFIVRNNGSYETRRNSVSKAVHRGSMDKELAVIIMKLAEEKRTKAFRDNTYLQNAYKKEMQADTIKAEALALLKR